MALYYASIGYTSDPNNRQTIPVGGNHPLKFGRSEQRDPWKMHADAGPLFRMPTSGIATIQLDVHWAAGTYQRRHYIAGEDQGYEGENITNRPDATFTHHTTVRAGETLAVLVGHDNAAPQDIAAARIQIIVDDDVAPAPDRRLRIRQGTDPDGPTLVEGPPTYGDGIEQPPVPEI